MVHAGLNADAVTFAHDLNRLGPEKFCAWLLEAYGDAVPKFPLYAFVHSEDLDFTELFTLVQPALPDDARSIARSGVALAAGRIANRTPTPGVLGTYAICRLVEELRVYEAVPVLTKAAASIAAGDDAIDSRTHLVLLREIFESMLRLLIIRVTEVSYEGGTLRLDLRKKMSVSQNFESLCTFAERSLVSNKPHATLVPIYAPLFFLSLAYLQLFRTNGGGPFQGEADQRLEVLKINFSAGPATAMDLYVFKSDLCPGHLGPYNLDAIVASWPRFVDDISGPKPLLFYDHIPHAVLHIRTSVTQLGYLSRTDAESAQYYLEVLQGDLDYSTRAGQE